MSETILSAFVQEVINKRFVISPYDYAFWMRVKDAFVQSDTYIRYSKDRRHPATFPEALFGWVKTVQPHELEKHFNAHEIMELLLPPLGES